MESVVCTNCGRLYPETSLPYRCPTCGGIYDYAGDLSFEPARVDESLRTIWRYSHTFGLPEGATKVSLGEGDTPLVLAEAFGREISFKLEYLNPTGSFKDRGSATTASYLLAHGVAEAVEDSSGNAGASFAAYAARAGISARVFIPDSASGPKQAQIAAYGATLTRVMGPRSNASIAVRRAADGGQTYASHVYLPFGLPGLATVAYEIVSQMSAVPGTLVAPVGQGSLLLAAWRGFRSLYQAGVTSQLPRLVGVQAAACAPLWAVYTAGAVGLGWVTERETLAEGVRIKTPIRGDPVLRAVEESGGIFVAVEEDAILPGRESLARLGFFVEPTSAIVWDGLNQVLEKSPDPVVVLLTGSGYKSV
jgi:threonine synthase